MKLFIANCTKRIQQFWYRKPETTLMRQVPIPVGAQVCLPDRDLSSAEIDAILRQHRHYGLLEAGAVRNHKGAVSLVYAIDKPVPVAVMQSAMSQNRGVDIKTGQNARKMMALQVNSEIAQQLAERGIPSEVTKLEVQLFPDDETAKRSDIDNDGDAIRVSTAEHPDAPASVRADQRRNGGGQRRGRGNQTGAGT